MAHSSFTNTEKQTSIRKKKQNTKGVRNIFHFTFSFSIFPVQFHKPFSHVKAEKLILKILKMAKTVKPKKPKS